MMNWVHQNENTNLRCPEWIHEADIPLRIVEISDNAINGIRDVLASRKYNQNANSFFSARNEAEIKQLIVQVTIHISNLFILQRFEIDITTRHSQSFKKRKHFET
jgi:hypothetical protein